MSVWDIGHGLNLGGNIGGGGGACYFYQESIVWSAATRDRGPKHVWINFSEQYTYTL